MSAKLLAELLAKPTRQCTLAPSGTPPITLADCCLKPGTSGVQIEAEIGDVIGVSWRCTGHRGLVRIGVPGTIIEVP